MRVDRRALTSQITPLKLTREVNRVILPALGLEATISEDTGHRWLQKLKYSRHAVAKSAYEHPDVVTSRGGFLQNEKKLQL